MIFADQAISKGCTLCVTPRTFIGTMDSSCAAPKGEGPKGKSKEFVKGKGKSKTMEEKVVKGDGKKGAYKGKPHASDAPAVSKGDQKGKTKVAVEPPQGHKGSMEKGKDMSMEKGKGKDMSMEKGKGKDMLMEKGRGKFMMEKGKCKSGDSYKGLDTNKGKGVKGKIDTSKGFKGIATERHGPYSKPDPELSAIVPAGHFETPAALSADVKGAKTGPVSKGSVKGGAMEKGKTGKTDIPKTDPKD